MTPSPNIPDAMTQPGTEPDESAFAAPAAPSPADPTAPTRQPGREHAEHGTPTAAQPADPPPIAAQTAADPVGFHRRPSTDAAPNDGEAAGSHAASRRHGPARGFSAATSAAIQDNPLFAVFGPLIVLLLGYSLYTTNSRFDQVSDSFGDVNDRFIALESRMDDRFAEVNDRFGQVNDRFIALEARLDDRLDSVEQNQAEIIRTLTAIDVKLQLGAVVVGEITSPDPPAGSDQPR